MKQTAFDSIVLHVQLIYLPIEFIRVHENCPKVKGLSKA